MYVQHGRNQGEGLLRHERLKMQAWGASKVVGRFLDETAPEDEDRMHRDDVVGRTVLMRYVQGGFVCCEFAGVVLRHRVVQRGDF